MGNRQQAGEGEGRGGCHDLVHASVAEMGFTGFVLFVGGMGIGKGAFSRDLRRSTTGRDGGKGLWRVGRMQMGRGLHLLGGWSRRWKRHEG